MTDSAVAMLCGIIGSVLFNISKGMQRHGIGAVASVLRSRGNRLAAGPVPGLATSATLYVTGLVLNNSLGLFAILANRYAPSSCFTSMFGAGVIALILYARFALHEPLRPSHYVGAAVLAAGTLVLGYDGIVREELTMARVNLPIAGIVIGTSLLLMAGSLAYVHRSESLKIVGVVYGLAAGFVASLDPLLKGIGQNLGHAERFLPSRSLGWVIFLASFGFATLSFVASQWIFSRGVRASVLVPSQSFAYVVYPVVLQAIALPGFKVSGLTASGLFFTILGVVVLHSSSTESSPAADTRRAQPG